MENLISQTALMLQSHSIYSLDRYSFRIYISTVSIQLSLYIGAVFYQIVTFTMYHSEHVSLTDHHVQRCIPNGAILMGLTNVTSIGLTYNHTQTFIQALQIQMHSSFKKV